jgi:hypothetical protein
MLTTRIDTWLATRRASGFALSKYERHLHRFAAFAAARGEDHIRTATALAWAKPGRPLPSVAVSTAARNSVRCVRTTP